MARSTELTTYLTYTRRSISEVEPGGGGENSATSRCAGRAPIEKGTYSVRKTFVGSTRLCPCCTPRRLPPAPRNTREKHRNRPSLRGTKQSTIRIQMPPPTPRAKKNRPFTSIYLGGGETPGCSCSLPFPPHSMPPPSPHSPSGYRLSKIARAGGGQHHIVTLQRQ